MKLLAKVFCILALSLVCTQPGQSSGRESGTGVGNGSDNVKNVNDIKRKLAPLAGDIQLMQDQLLLLAQLPARHAYRLSDGKAAAFLKLVAMASKSMANEPGVSACLKKDLTLLAERLEGPERYAPMTIVIASAELVRIAGSLEQDCTQP